MAVKPVTESTRDIDELHPLVGTLLELALKEIRRKGINPLVVETYRSLERQYYTYCKGRTLAQAINGGVPKAKAEKYVAQLKSERYAGGKVSWTLNSVHISRQAVDVVPQRKVNGRLTAIWNSNDKETKQIVSIMQKYGFEAGANWKKSPDSPHFQIKGKLDPVVFKRRYTTIYVTKAIQIALNRVPNLLKNKISEDGKWGPRTNDAVSAFRKYMGYKSSKSMLGREALKDLFNKAYN